MRPCLSSIGTSIEVLQPFTDSFPAGIARAAGVLMAQDGWLSKSQPRKPAIDTAIKPQCNGLLSISWRSTLSCWLKALLPRLPRVFNNCLGSGASPPFFLELGYKVDAMIESRDAVVCHEIVG
eukprot:34305-Amphidinium_carterae.1